MNGGGTVITVALEKMLERTYAPKNLAVVIEKPKTGVVIVVDGDANIK